MRPAVNASTHRSSYVQFMAPPPGNTSLRQLKSYSRAFFFANRRSHTAVELGTKQRPGVEPGAHFKFHIAGDMAGFSAAPRLRSRAHASIRLIPTIGLWATRRSRLL